MVWCVCIEGGGERGRGSSSAMYGNKGDRCNRPFPSSKKSHFQSEAKCEAIDMKMIFNYDAKKLIFTTKVSHLASFWKWDFLELGNGLLHPFDYQKF